MILNNCENWSLLALLKYAVNNQLIKDEKTDSTQEILKWDNNISLLKKIVQAHTNKEYAINNIETLMRMCIEAKAGHWEKDLMFHNYEIMIARLEKMEHLITDLYNMNNI